jgi:hypothetical protein
MTPKKCKELLDSGNIYLITSPKELCNFRFIDGSPCGVLDETNTI